MLLSRRAILVLFIIFSQSVEGSKGIVVVVGGEDEEYIKFSGSGDLSGVISDQDISPCCTTGNCTCDSFLHALVSLTDNVMIYITTDVVLSSIVPIVGVENITIVGHDSPTVYCNNKGGVRFVSCNNVIVEGIVWKGCGTKNSPTFGILNSSNITIQQCNFQHSLYQAVQLSNVSEHVYINNCIFAHNFLHTRGWRHGAVTFNLSQNSQVNLTIDNCYFINNRGAKSVVYIYGNSDKPISVRNSVFTNNHMVSIYVYNHSLHINGNVTFENNKGSSIFVLYSNITFAGNSAVTFYNNSAHYGGAIYSDDNSVISFKGHCRVNFTANRAVVDGGAVYSIDDSVISFEGSSIMTFAKNMANWGGAMYSKDNSNISFKGDSTVTYDENRALQNGGAIYLDRNSVISFQEHSFVRIDNNNAILGGAIFYFIECGILFEGHSKVTFNKNNAIGTGGAIHSDDNYVLSFKGNTEVTFTENNAAGSGGAITDYKYNNISFEGQSVVLFERNTAEIDGGAIYSSFHSTVSIKEQSEVLFIANRARAGGGAMHVTDNSTLLSTGNSKAIFTENTAVDGGAMYLKTTLLHCLQGAP